LALMGNGVLAIWNGIDPVAEDEFVSWHVREHIPERVSLPGFLRGRRYVALGGHPKYFNFYETESAADLASPAYLARLNAPTDWTRRVVAHFRDTSRTICDVAWSIGEGEGGFVEAVVLSTDTEAKRFAEEAHRVLADAYRTRHGLVGIHLLRGHANAAAGDTAEARLRGAPDRIAPWILLTEASTAEALREFRNAEGRSESLSALGLASVMERGIYQMQFALAKTQGPNAQ
jgi:hypothetical protein